MGYYRAAMDNTFDCVRMLQVQNERTFDMAMRKIPWITDSCRQLAMNWILEIHKVETVVIDYNKRFVDACFEQAENFFLSKG